METIKTVPQVLRANPQFKKLIKDVIANLDVDQMPDVVAHGIDGGFGNFIYYTDTVAFFNRNKKQIIEYVTQMVDELGEPNEFEFIASFNCLKRNMDSDMKKSIYRLLGGASAGQDDTTVANALAWFAAEEVSRMFVD